MNKCGSVVGKRFRRISDCTGSNVVKANFKVNRIKRGYAKLVEFQLAELNIESLSVNKGNNRVSLSEQMERLNSLSPGDGPRLDLAANEFTNSQRR